MRQPWLATFGFALAFSSLVGCSAAQKCVDDDRDGYGTCDGDCDDGDPNVHPGAAELCNHRDDDCNGTIDEGFDLQSDHENCGGCGQKCNADQACAAGQCVACSNVTSPPPESCTNRVDDDCDGLVDCADPDCNGQACDTGHACQTGTCQGGACVPSGVKSAGTACRPAAGVCDAAEQCDGASPDCPADSYEPQTVQCRAAADACDLPSYCTSISPLCPPNQFRPSTYQCRAASGVCENAANCTGTSASCPASTFKPSATLCRAAAGVCDVAESCTGSSAACPADAVRPNTYVCSQWSACRNTSYCDGTTKGCAPSYWANGTPCGGSECVSMGACQSGTCVGTTPSPAGTQCTLGDICGSAASCDGSGQCCGKECEFQTPMCNP